jgi:hypothetical protein
MVDLHFPPPSRARHCLPAADSESLTKLSVNDHDVLEVTLRRVRRMSTPYVLRAADGDPNAELPYAQDEGRARDPAAGPAPRGRAGRPDH